MNFWLCLPRSECQSKKLTKCLPCAIIFPNRSRRFWIYIKSRILMWPCMRNLTQFLITALKQIISLYFRNQQSSTGFANHYFNEYYAKIRKLYLQCQERRCHVRADINHDKKIILVWKSTQELDLPVPDELECDIRPLREKKIQAYNNEVGRRGSV